MKKAGRLRRIGKGIVFLAILCLLLRQLSVLLIRKDEYSRYRQFYSEEDSFDVLFFGSSRMLDAVQPMELWNHYGIKSYNLAQHSENLSRNYWSMRSAIRYNKPEVIVVDVSLFTGSYAIPEDAGGEEKAYLHNMLDHIPLSAEKLRIVRELCPRSLYLEYLFPFVLYHGRWSELTGNDFRNEQSPRKGAEIRNRLVQVGGIEWPTEEDAEVFFPSGINLDRIFALCRENNIRLIGVCLPVPEASYYTTINSFEHYFEENGATFLNFWKMEDFMDYDVDFADLSHVNQAGGKRITDWLGRYLAAELDPDHSENRTDAEWDEIAEQYLAVKDNLILGNQSDPRMMLLNLVADPDYRCEVEIASEEVPGRYNLQRILPALRESCVLRAAEAEEYEMRIVVYREGREEAVADVCYYAQE